MKGAKLLRTFIVSMLFLVSSLFALVPNETKSVFYDGSYRSFMERVESIRPCSVYVNLSYFNENAKGTVPLYLQLSGMNGGPYLLTLWDATTLEAVFKEVTTTKGGIFTARIKANNIDLTHDYTLLISCPPSTIRTLFPFRKVYNPAWTLYYGVYRSGTVIDYEY